MGVVLLSFQTAQLTEKVIIGCKKYTVRGRGEENDKAIKRARNKAVKI